MHRLDDEEGGDQEAAGGDEGGVAQGGGRIDVFEKFHRGDPKQGEDQPGHGQHQRQQHGVGLGQYEQIGANLNRCAGQGAHQSRAGRGGNGDGSDNRSDVGLENVGAHAGGIADAVTDVVGNNARVAGIVLGNAGFHLADQVRTNVGRLGVDAAADTGEECDRRGAHGETVDVDGGLGVTAEGNVGNADPDQAHGSHREPHDGATVERDHQRLALAVGAGSLSRPDVGMGGRLHADKTAEHRAERAAQKRQRRIEPEAGRQDDQEKDEDDEDRQHRVLALQKGHGTAPDRFGDFLHLLAADGLNLDHAVDHECDGKADRPQDGCKHLYFHLNLFLPFAFLF